MDTDEIEARAGVVDAARALDAQGLNRGTSGNVSLRFRDGLLITPRAFRPGGWRPTTWCSWAWTGVATIV